jgi:hypothetical protein
MSRESSNFENSILLDSPPNNELDNILPIKSIDPVLNMSIGARQVSIGDVATATQQSQLLANVSTNKQLGIIQGYGNTNQMDSSGILESNLSINLSPSELKFRRNTFWKSCCNSIIDKRATVFFTQVAIGAIVIFFAMSKMWISEEHKCSGADPSIYIGLISVILGWFVPAPSMV